MEMKKTLLVCITLLFCSLLYAQTNTTFILVRHAEKADDGTKDPPLNEVGISRASTLATLLSNQEVTALYSTPFKRTRQTLAPLAESAKLEISDYDPFAGDDWLKSLHGSHAGGTVVIVGHSNTIPALANRLLGSETFAQFEESEYSNLIIIVSQEFGAGKLIRLTF